LGRGKKNGSFGFAKRWFGVSGQNQMCRLCGWLKLFLKKCGGKKNKKHRVGLSVGLLAVPLQYGLYVFGHLSKWFVSVLMFNFSRLFNGCSVVLHLPVTGLGFAFGVG
jgi:hypothetical protein